MLNQLVWSLCIGTEAALLVRLARTGMFKRFTVFFLYLACVLAKDLLSIPIYSHLPSVYAAFYYTAELILAALGYGVLVEIYRRSLEHYPGVARFFTICFAVVFLAVIIGLGVGSSVSPFARVVAELEQDLRQSQAIMLCCLLALFMYYRITFGRNLRGLVTGYSLLVGSQVITLTFALSVRTGFGAFMREAEPVFYALSLLIWLVALWVPQREITPVMPCGIERDYERLAAATRTMLLRARAQLGKMARA